jgi:hypothetical protein
MGSVEPIIPGEIVPDEEKFRELVLLVAEELLDEDTYGATLLNKGLFYAEFLHMRSTGRPISGVEYQRLPQGPAPRRLKPIRTSLLHSGDARLDETDYRGFTQHRLVPLRPARRERFTEDELRSVKQGVAVVASLSATQASELSHEEVGWKMVEEGETIPYEAAFLRRPVVTPRTQQRIAELAAELIR